jgi:DUF4097 and DUF4098 domain-containing protein YvlB
MKLRPVHLLLLLPLLAPALHAAEETTATIKFSDPAKPGLLRLYVSRGDVRIKGEETDEVKVSSSAQPEGRNATRRDGLRVISTAASFSLSEKDNVIELNYGSGAGGGSDDADFIIVVPRNTALDVTTGWGGDIEVQDVSGDVEVKNMNGEIELAGLGGGALVETMNGEITASFASLPSGKPLSFTSMNGEIALRLPADTKANVRIRTQNGSILTDFSETELVTKSESTSADAREIGEAARIAGDVAREVAAAAREVAAEVKAAMEADRAGRSSENVRAPKAPRPPRTPSIPAMAGGKVVSGTLNGGGADIQIATMNGDIVVRKNVERAPR